MNFDCSRPSVVLFFAPRLGKLLDMIALNVVAENRTAACFVQLRALFLVCPDSEDITIFPCIDVLQKMLLLLLSLLLMMLFIVNHRNVWYCIILAAKSLLAMSIQN